MSDLLRCPFCPCSFVCVGDLVLHLPMYSLQVTRHIRKFKEVHEWVGCEIERKHGGVDKSVRCLAKIILEEGEKVFGP